MMAADVLIDAGFRVVEAGDADEAMVLLEARADARVLVTDVKMPGNLDGFGLAHLVSKRWPDIGIIVTSGHARPGPGDLPPGATFLPKPYQPSALVTAVQKLAGTMPVRVQATEPADPIAVEDAVIAPSDASAAELFVELEAAPDAGAVRREKDGEPETP